MARRVLVTGGAGFIGSSLAVHLSRSGRAVVAFDNLHRRGSELNLGRLAQAGVAFVHGDIRIREDLEAAGAFDLIIECSAEPSVHAGYAGEPSYLLGANLVGTLTCLEAARRRGAGMLFLSTSRVYPIERLRGLPLHARETRLVLGDGARGQGWSAEGVAEDFPLEGYRSLYGATKLAAELLLEEYRQMYGMPTAVNRCGVVAGPWQMGKVDQGFVTLWAARHLWGTSLAYTGFGGQGLQVRDVLHIDDLCDLVDVQMDRLTEWSGRALNAGGGAERSVSLRELTTKCEERSGRRLRFEAVADTAPADVPYYVTDNRGIRTAYGWSPRRSLDAVLDDVFAWLRAGEQSLRPFFT
jgi:CDP-paratose 2-epimerase